MKIEIKENERIDNLDINNLKIIQNKEGFCFGVDAVILSDFAKEIKEGSKVLDLGTGTGIISVLLTAKTKLKKIYGIEIQKEVYEMAKRSVILNELEDKFEVIHSDIKSIGNVFEKNSFDAIVSNPPYKKENSGITNIEEKKNISRNETTANLEDFIKVSKDMLKDKGEMYLVHRPDRIVDILSLMRKYRIEPKKIRLVFGNEEKEPKMILIKGIKGANEFLKFESNLYIYNKEGKYSDEINRIYGREI